MERLTARLDDGRAYLNTHSEKTNIYQHEENNPIAKLADYEDTGLTPDQIEEMKQKLDEKNQVELHITKVSKHHPDFTLDETYEEL